MTYVTKPKQYNETCYFVQPFEPLWFHSYKCGVLITSWMSDGARIG